MKTDYTNCPLCGEKLVGPPQHKEFTINYGYKYKCPNLIDWGNQNVSESHKHHFIIYHDHMRMIIKPFMIINSKTFGNIIICDKSIYQSTICELCENDGEFYSSPYLQPKKIAKLNTIIEPSPNLTAEKIKKYILFS